MRVARVGKPFGVRGEVTVQLFTDAPETRLVPGAQLSFDDRGTRCTTVTGARRSGARWVLALAGIDDRDQAELVRGEQLYAQADEAPSGGSDEWFDWQLIGLPVVDPVGRALGEVTGVEHPPAQDLLVVTTPDGTVARVPLVAQIVPEITDERITVDAPDGLFEEE